jgi:hypothetical protein
MQLTRNLSLASSIEAEGVRLITPALAAQYACNPRAAQSGDRGSRNDGTASGLTHLVHSVLDAEEYGSQQDREAAVPVFGAGLLDRPDRADQTCIVIDDVEVSKFLDRPINGALGVLLAGYVGELDTRCRPFSLQSPTALSLPSRLRSAIMTAAPSPANRIAVARPIPLAALVTKQQPSSLPMNSLRAGLKLARSKRIRLSIVG